MAYTKNPFLPKVRADAVKMVLSGKGVRETARYFGVQPSTVSKWMNRAPEDFRGNPHIETKSSRPHSHPNAINESIKQRIYDLRHETKRCAEVIHKYLENEGVKVSLSTVKRVLNRAGMLKKRSKWKKYHKPIARPDIRKPGDLVQIDTIHMTYPGKQEKIYIYTLLDVYSRWAHAWATPKIGAGVSVRFVEDVLKKAPFKFHCIQSDHGTEFSAHFKRNVILNGMLHRHSRVRTPNDNSHLERFNRTVQEECLFYLPLSVEKYNQALQNYIPFYNQERLHLGIDLQTPSQLLQCFQAID